jgi:hypothetical protein
MRGIGLFEYGNPGDVVAWYKFGVEITTTHSDYGTFPFVILGLMGY